MKGKVFNPMILAQSKIAARTKPDLCTMADDEMESLGFRVLSKEEGGKG